MCDRVAMESVTDGDGDSDELTSSSGAIGIHVLRYSASAVTIVVPVARIAAGLGLAVISGVLAERPRRNRSVGSVSSWAIARVATSRDVGRARNRSNGVFRSFGMTARWCGQAPSVRPTGRFMGLTADAAEVSGLWMAASTDRCVR